MTGRRLTLAVVAAFVALGVLVGCTTDTTTSPATSSSSAAQATGPADKTLRIVAGSEQRSVLDEIVEPWCQKNGYSCPYTLMGSVDQARLLQSGSTDYDAYWFASSVFAQLGNTGGHLIDLQPMFMTPTVFAGWKSKMDALGFTGKQNIGVKDILAAVESKKTRVWATNPTQSNSGATTLFSFLNYFAGNGPGQALTQAQLDSAKVDQGITRFVQAMDRTPPSTGTMMDECLADKASCDTLFTYEDLVIEKNQELVKAGKEPLQVVYPVGSLAISDAPLGFLPVGDQATARKTIFTALQTYLLKDAGAQQTLRSLGRRPADAIGLTLTNPDTKVFNPAWGIKTDIREQGITFPSAAVIQAALDRYHTRYRRPVDVYYCLDGSGSMAGDGWQGVQDAAHQIFNPTEAQRNLLLTAPGDTTTVTIFNSNITAGPWTVTGNAPAALLDLEKKVVAYQPGDGTNMYTCLDAARASLSSDPRKKLIVLMTDGKSSGDADAGVRAAAAANIPIVAIAFGDADPTQLKPLAERTGGAYVASKDLVAALRTAAGYR